MKNYEESGALAIAKEYEEFVYIVSHDLNTPLRHVREFSQMLVSSLDKKLDKEQQEYVRYLQVTLDRLEKMQEALLAYSRVATRGLPFQKVQSLKLVEEALDALEYNKDDVEIEIGDWPEIFVDRRQFRMVFYYLLDNALKFHKEGARKQIAIRAEEKDREIIFRISDNGVGMEKEFYEQAFKLFKKLNTAQDYPSIGAGLTIAKKIVERHNGNILIKSRPGKGTEISVIVPASGAGYPEENSANVQHTIEVKT